MAHLDLTAVQVAMARKSIGTIELADRAGISVQTLRRAMYKNRPMRLSTIGRIAEALNVDVTEIATF